MGGVRKMVANFISTKGYSLLEFLASLAVSAVLLSVLSTLLVVGQSRTMETMEAVSELNTLQGWLSRLHGELITARTLHIQGLNWQLQIVESCGGSVPHERRISYTLKAEPEGGWRLLRTVMDAVDSAVEDVEWLVLYRLDPRDWLGSIMADYFTAKPAYQSQSMR